MINNLSEKPIGWSELRNQNFNNFYLREISYEGNLVMPRHSHEEAHISFLLQGTFNERFGLKNHENKTSALVIRPAGEDHSVKFNGAGARIFSIHFKPQFLEYIQGFTNLLNTPLTMERGRPESIAKEIYRESGKTDSIFPLMCEALILELLVTVSRSATTTESGTPLWLKRTEEFLHANFSRSLSLEQVAEIAGVHPIYLARVFREKNRRSVGKYVQQLRIQFAADRIASTTKSLAEIAFSAGFADQSHLCRTFKSYFGITATEYRKNFR